MTKCKLVLCTGILFGLSFPALSGDYADGYGATAAEAIKSARDGAELAVKSRDSGCVGPGKDGQAELLYVGKVGDLYHFKAHYNHHDGSCGLKKSVGDWIKDLGL